LSKGTHKDILKIITTIINRVTIKLFEPVKPAFRKTMTFDNGRGFCGHEKLSESSELKTFFANPYHSWERGLNEHTNGLIREFYPKSTNFNIVKEEDFQRAVDFINHRPRKSLESAVKISLICHS